VNRGVPVYSQTFTGTTPSHGKDKYISVIWDISSGSTSRHYVDRDSSQTATGCNECETKQYLSVI